MDEVVMQKTLLYDAADHKHSFVGLGFINGKLGAFAVFEECTPRFVQQRSFVTRVFYTQSNVNGLALGLLNFFETWAKDQKIQYHLISTKRRSGSAIRLFTGPKYGFVQNGLMFAKVL